FQTPAEDRGVIPAATAVRQHAAPGERVVTIHGSSFDLLYYCDRTGWALPIDDDRLAEKLQACRVQNARLLAISDVASLAQHPAAEAIVSRLPLVAAGNDFRLYRLDSAITSAAQSPVPRQP
ncbi:MAG TPA: hypothetical protein VHY20_13425, partial [Pirellulales bacterium]|nr:hypothetical protein [Pirellulales bacterium]